MSADPIPDAHRLLAETDWLRSLARSLVGTTDADDLCQATLVAALERAPKTGDGLRPWLASVARRLSARMHRSKARQAVRERASARHEAIPSAAELVQQAATQKAVVAAVLQLDEPYRETVLLRYWHGLSNRELAAHCGVPLETARTRLKRALATLRARLDQDRGSRAAWAPAVGAFGGAMSNAPNVTRDLIASGGATASWISGVFSMSVKTKLTILAAAAVALLAYATVWSGTPNARAPEAPAAPPTPLVASDDPGAEDQQAETPGAREAVAEPTTAAANATTGALVVRVVYDDAPLAEVGVRALAGATTDRHFGSVLARTDTDGRARFPALDPGACSVWTDRGRTDTSFYRPEIVAGTTTELVIDLKPGIDLEGLVVAPDGTAVAGAEVYLSAIVFMSGDADPVATTDARGRFELRGCNPKCMLGARAFGYTQAPMRLIAGRAGATVPVRLELGSAGGGVTGQVVDRDGEPVSRAVVRIGTGGRNVSVGRQAGAAQDRTETDGKFAIIGVPPGEHTVAVRAPDYGMWTGSCSVDANAMTPLHITILDGVSCTGTVTAEGGSPVPGAHVHAGKRDTLSWFSTRTDAEGRYRFQGLPAGPLEIAAEQSKGGRAKTELYGSPGQSLTWDARLSNGIGLVGRVVLESGEPVVGADVIAVAPTSREGWLRSATSGKDGRFVIHTCPEGAELRVEVYGANIERATVAGVDPLVGELVVRTRPADARNVTIRGTVLGPHGSPCGEAMAWVLSRPGPNSGFKPCDENGGFEIGRLRPGEHRLCVRSENYPDFETELRRLAAHETWDVGVIRLVEGGRVRVELSGERSGYLSMIVLDEAGDYAGRVANREGAKVSKPLAPGRYRLSVTDAEAACQVIPFEVRAGETARLDVRFTAGLVQVIEVASPFDDEITRDIQIAVHSSEGELVAQSSRGIRGNGTVTFRCAFAAGDYTVSATCGGRRGSARFQVAAAATDAAPVRVSIH